jgi:ligand-binding sensor domain-containing protein/serine phosphatase RsbU (regulator of sigma subunit)
MRDLYKLGMKKLLVLFVLLFVLSCVHQDKSEPGWQDTLSSTQSSIFSSGIKLAGGSDTLKPPVTIPAGKATLIKIPKNSSSTYIRKAKSGETVVVKVMPPVNHPAAILNAPIGIPHFTNYSTEQGLALSGVRCSCIDKRGNIWFGTEGGGVSRYDGKSFNNFTTAQGLASNLVKSMMEDRMGNIWFGTVSGGVSRYDGKSFTNFTTAQGLSNSTVWCITEDKKGNMWFGTEGGGICRYDGKSFTTYTTAQGLPNDRIRCMTKSKTGDIWFGTLNGGLCKYNGISFTDFTASPGLSNKTIWSITEDKKGNIWLGTEGGGVSKYDGKSFTNFTTEQGLPSNTIWSITEDQTGNIWFGTESGGVSKYDGKSFANYTTLQGLANNTIWSITEDKAGSLWFGTEGGGVSRYDGNAFSNFTTAQGLSDNVVLSILQDKTGNIWFGTYGGGVCKYDGKSFTNFTTEQGFANNNVYSITEDKTGNLWFGTEGGGVCRYDGKSFTNFTVTQGLPSNIVLSIIEDKKGNLWFGTYGRGVSRFDGKSFTTFTTAQGLANDNVFSILEDKAGNIWFGTVDGGLSRYDGKSFTNFTTLQGLPNNTIWCITEDTKTGNLWLGTAEGLCLITLNNTKNGLVKFTNYSINNGLPDNFITNVLQLPNKKIAVGTNKGLAVFNPALPVNDMGRLAELEVYNSSNGFPVKDVNAGQHAMYLDSKNIIWAATGDEKTAVARIDYNAIYHDMHPPTVVIQKVMINEKDICWYDLRADYNRKHLPADSALITQQEMITYGKSLNSHERELIKQNYNKIGFDGITTFYPLPQNLVLPYENNNISFEFNVIEPGRSYVVNYQYKLEGYDKDWSPVLQKSSATFGNISAGTYTFKLKAQGPNGVWCEPVTYTFKVLPQWFRTWWAYTFYAIVICGILYGLFRWRTATLYRERELLEEKVKIRTEQLVKQTEFAEKQREIAESQQQLVQEKAKEIMDSIHYAKRIQTALLTSHDYITEHIPDKHFVLFKPKDIVSGDFYWALQHKNKFYLATCDCTGHGVPGAFMSMLNISFLNEVILERGITEPHEILNHVRDEIISSLNPKGSKEVSMDGMDAVLCCFDFENMKLTFAAANNSLWLIRNNELTEYKADKMPVGKYNEEMRPFTLQTLDLVKGDVIYTSTDGFSDQPSMNNKKLMKKNLKEQLLFIHTRPMSEQKEYLDAFFENWKGNTEQMDDVCIVGVRI